MVLVQFIANGWSSTIEQNQSRAEQLLFEALAQDPNNSMAHYAMGQLRRAENRLAEALSEFEAAVALDHNNAWAVLLVGGMLRWLGRPQEGIPYVESAIRLNPHDPNIAAFYWVLAHSYLLLGDVDQSIVLFRRAIAANRELWFLHLNLAGALGLRGDLNEARAALAESFRLNPNLNSFSLARPRDFSRAGNPNFWALWEKTVAVGLRRAGFPD